MNQCERMDEVNEQEEREHVGGRRHRKSQINAVHLSISLSLSNYCNSRECGVKLGPGPVD